MSKRAILLTAAIALSACAAAPKADAGKYKDKGPFGERGTALAPPTDTPADPAEGTACNLDAARAFIGKPGAQIADEARAAAGARSVRVIKPDTMVTMDFRPDRLNLKTDDAGVVKDVSCG
ncbi:I78 family peptidase inhibitor [Sphingomonas crocodyli]|uniref:Peptidase inhibitor I78 n=1 Tax=Sphingomonas crocodyli TaxID=1979270 RepID=A0A437LVT7_9SPHN|nr:I78 family peptidase inhibitor [Sphingomonas crocodyli]RVT89499.1 hypothetical protein EOD43_22340 [Sphingomonas crocodyli]